MIDDLHWFGFQWGEGPDCGGPFGPYAQSQRRHLYLEACKRLAQLGLLYPCSCSRKDVLNALGAPHLGEEEPVYPGTCRPAAPRPGTPFVPTVTPNRSQTSRVNWRFRVPSGQTVSFLDSGQGPQDFIAGTDFGDFVLWRHDNAPSYQLAVVVDDAAMQITEVVRGADLLLSTARQILLYQALQWPLPRFHHCPLMTDSSGLRLAKRHDSLSLQSLRARGADPAQLRQRWFNPPSAA